MAQKSVGWASLVCGHRTHVAHVLALVVFACLAALWPISAAQAACSSPQTATITSGGTATFTCADFGFISPANVSPSHGGLTFGIPSNTSALIYTNNGDGATSDTFIVKDDFAVPITFNITINPSTSPLTVAPSSVATPVIGMSYNQALSTSGGTGPYTYSLVAGSNLPPGLSLSSSGVISGTPTGSGAYNFTVRVVDSTTPTVNTLDKAYSVLIAAPVIDVTPDTPPHGGVGMAYSVQFSASGGTPGYTYTRDSGSLPAGLSLSGSGLLSGTPSAVGSSTFKLKVQDSTTISTGGVHFLLQDVTVTINAFPPVSLTPASGTAFSAGVVGTSYSNASISASGGSGTISYAVTAGALPAGLSINASTGAITGTPTVGAIGTANFTVTATAATSGSASANYSITVAAPPGGTDAGERRFDRRYGWGFLLQYLDFGERRCRDDHLCDNGGLAAGGSFVEHIDRCDQRNADGGWVRHGELRGDGHGRDNGLGFGELLARDRGTTGCADTGKRRLGGRHGWSDLSRCVNLGERWPRNDQLRGHSRWSSSGPRPEPVNRFDQWYADGRRVRHA